MKYCQHCGNQLNDSDIFCSSCGAPFENNQQNNNPNQTYDPYHVNQEKVDESKSGLNVLSFIFPIVGFILYLVWKNEYPIKAKSCGKWAIIGFVVSLVFEIVGDIILNYLMVIL